MDVKRLKINLYAELRAKEDMYRIAKEQAAFSEECHNLKGIMFFNERAKELADEVARIAIAIKVIEERVS